jgi:hypothetical protein
MATEVQAQVDRPLAVPAPAVDQQQASEPPTKVEPPKKESPKKDAKGSKSKASDKSKKSKGAKSADSSEPGTPSVAAHPRAAHHVALAKGWGGLVGFVVCGYLSLPTNTFTETGLRALVGGVVCYMVAWAATVFVWRHLVVLEIKSREQELLSAAYLEAAGVASSASPSPIERARAGKAS